METGIGLEASRSGPPAAAGAQRPARTRPFALPGWLTVEIGLLGGVLCLAAGLRFLGLGDGVLAAEESRRAFTAWQIVRGEPASLEQGPALLFPAALLLFLIGANDTVARLLPALAGTFVVAWPYLVRRQLGRGAALVACLSLAVSPSLVFASRTLAGETVALALLLLATLGWLRYREGRGPVWLAVAGASAGLTLAAGPAAFALAVPVGVVVAASVAPARGRVADLVPAGDVWRRGGTYGAAAAILLATGLLSRPDGLQTGIVDAAAAWVGSLLAGEPVRPAYHYVAGLAVYEPAALCLALAGLITARRGRRCAAFLLAWAGVALLVYSLGVAKESSRLALVAFPLALAAGRGAVDAWEAFGKRLDAAGVGLFLASALPAVGLWGTIATNVATPGTALSPALLAVPPALFGLVAAYWVRWQGARKTFSYVACLVALLLLGAQLRAGLGLVFAQETRPEELLAGGKYTQDVRNLLREIEAHAAIFSTPGRRDIAVLVDERLKDPLAWYLRDYSRVTYGATADSPLAVVAMPDREPPAGSYGYKQYTWAVHTHPALDAPGRLWLWLVYRDSGSPVVRESVRLYVALKINN